MNRLRRTLYVYLHTAAWTGKGLSLVNKVITTLIIFSIVTVVIETEPSIYAEYSMAFDLINLAVAIAFMIEYVLRLWVMGEHPDYAGGMGRIKYAVTLTAIIDLIAVLPFLMGIGGADAFLLRGLRLLRIFSLAKLGRFSTALQLLGTAVRGRSYELLISFGFSIVILLFSSTVMYLVEGSAQPDRFGSIPRALWWSIATLTTVGYGDVYPVTVVGKLFAGLTAAAAIGIVAMPTGILAAAFSDAVQQRRDDA